MKVHTEGMNRSPPHSEHLCRYFQAAMDILARPWNGLIIAALHARGELRFSEIGGLIGVADRMLSERLKELEARGLLERVVDGGPPVKVSYRLTEIGQGFGEAQKGLSKWGRELVQ
jgi:DNA-binding HxlR family transcriptional regulator